MNRSIKRTVTITITETWTIVWTTTDDPLSQAPVTTDNAPNRAEEAPTAPPVNPNNALPDRLTKGLGSENHPPAPGEMIQPPDGWPVSTTTDRRRKRVRRRRAKDRQKRSAEETDNDDTSYAGASHVDTAGRSPAG